MRDTLDHEKLLDELGEVLRRLHTCDKTIRISYLETLISSVIDTIKRLSSAEQEWMSASDNPPKLEQDVFVFGVSKEHPWSTDISIGRRRIFKMFPWSEGEVAWDVSPYYTETYDITHWMPLPEPPAKERSKA